MRIFRRCDERPAGVAAGLTFSPKACTNLSHSFLVRLHSRLGQQECSGFSAGSLEPVAQKVLPRQQTDWQSLEVTLHSLTAFGRQGDPHAPTVKLIVAPHDEPFLL